MDGSCFYIYASEHVCVRVCVCVYVYVYALGLSYLTIHRLERSDGGEDEILIIQASIWFSKFAEIDNYGFS